jgi:rubrerythrin
VTTDQTRTLEALRTAIQLEIDGKNYYLKASRSSQNELGAKLFKTLAAEEDTHRKKFEEIYKVIQSKNTWPVADFTLHTGPELKTLFAEASENVKSTDTELAAVQTAMEMENKTHDFYIERAGKALFDEEKKYYITLAGIESTHHAVLLDYYEYLKNPAGWFTMKERHSLDGG